MLNKSFSLFLIVILLIGIAPVKFISVAAAAGESIVKQNEVPTDYIGIYSPEDFKKVRENLGGKYILMNDIDLTEATGEGGVYNNDGAGWSPIGDATAPFAGVFDGNGYKITGLKVTLKSDQTIYAGLFGYAKNAKILNLGMEGNNITADNTSVDASTAAIYAGGIVGYGNNIEITNSYHTGTVSANSFFSGYAGGIVGYISNSYNFYSTISNSYNTGSVFAKTAAGGIAGEISRTRITNAYNEGTLATKTTDYTGGIAGRLLSSSSISTSYNRGEISYGSTAGGIAGLSAASSIENSYNLGELSSAVSFSKAGGIVGVGNSSAISKSYNTGSITSSVSSSEAGGIAGYLQSSSSIVDAFNTGDIKVGNNAGGIVGDLYGSLIKQTYNTGLISGSYAGGVGSTTSNSTIVDSFNIGSIKASYDGGGIAGYSRDTEIRNTYNVGAISSAIAGGIAGDFEGSIENSYFSNVQQFGVRRGVSEGTFKKSFEELMDPSSFEGFDFSAVWKGRAGSGFSFPSFNEAPSADTEENLNLAITAAPQKAAYLEGEQLDLTGAKVQLTTNHGKQVEVDITQNMVSGFNPNKAGFQRPVVSYGGLTTSFSVFIEETHNVTFKDMDGTVLKTETVIHRGAATAPEIQKRKGYTFIGWDSDIGWNSDFSTVKADMILKAKYAMDTFLVNFLDGGQVLERGYLQAEMPVSQPANPIKSGYTFVDWYQDQSFQMKYDFEAPLMAELNLYARFVENPETANNLKASTADSTRLKISWDQVSGVDGYELQRSTSSEGDFYYRYLVDPNEQDYLIDDLTIDTTYFFKIRTYRIVDDQYVYSSFSPVISGKPMLAGVSSAKASATSYNKVKLSWTSASEAAGFEVHRATSLSGTYSNIKTIANSSTESFENTSLSTGKTYYYKIRAYGTVDGKKVYSPFSSVVSAKPSLSAVTSAKATSAGYNKNKVSWAQVSGASGYAVYRATSKTGTYSRIKTVTSGSTLSYENTSLTAGKTYYYKVRAYRVVGGANVYGAYSSIVSAVPALAKPTKISVAKTSGTSIKVSWTKVTEACGYELYRATSSSGAYTKIKTQTSVSSIGYTNTSLTRGKTYYYKVRAYRTVSGKKVYSPFTTVVSYKL